MSGQCFYRVDPDRHRKNKLDKLSRIPFNVYTGLHSFIERPVKQVAHMVEAVHTSEVWTLEQLRIFLEKFFIYKRDFMRIADFFPFKTPKDMVSLYYAIKKHLGLSEREKEIRDFVGNKYHFINEIVETAFNTFFKSLDENEHSYMEGYHQSLSLQHIMVHLGKLNAARDSAPPSLKTLAHKASPMVV